MGTQPIFDLPRPGWWSIANVGRATFMQIPCSRVRLRGRDWHIGVFKKRLGRDAANSVRGFHQVVAGAANVFVAEGIGKRDRFGELTGAHQEARAVHIPIALADHDFSLAICVYGCHAGSPGPMVCWSGVTLRAEWGEVNYT